LQYAEGQTAESLGITGEEEFSLPLDDTLQARSTLQITATDPSTGESKQFEALCRIDTPVEVDYYRNGGILQTVLRKLLTD
jgi:aconitate hydratase